MAKTLKSVFYKKVNGIIYKEQERGRKMLNIISSWKFKDVHKSKKEPDVFYILQSQLPHA